MAELIEFSSIKNGNGERNFKKKRQTDPKILPDGSKFKNGIKKLQISPEAIKAQREIVRQWPDDELLKKFKTLRQQDRAKNPAFFQAIADELIERDILK